MAGKEKIPLEDKPVEELTDLELNVLATRKQITEYLNGTAEQMKQVPKLKKELRKLEKKLKVANTPFGRKVLVAIVAIFIVVSCSAFFGESEEEKAARLVDEKAEKVAQSQKEKAEKVTRLKKEKADKNKGFHCLSQWNGSHRELASLTKESLKDPSSFKHIETRIKPVSPKKQHEVFMKYTATNSFGGRVPGSVFAVIDHETCKVLSIINSK